LLFNAFFSKFFNVISLRPDIRKQQLRPRALIKAPPLFITVVQKLNQGLPKTAVDRFRSCFFGTFLQEQKSTRNIDEQD